MWMAVNRRRRDYAILMLLSRLGMRNGEVSRLRLQDIDWQVGRMLIRGRRNYNEMLPLPAAGRCARSRTSAVMKV